MDWSVQPMGLQRPAPGRRTRPLHSVGALQPRSPGPCVLCLSQALTACRAGLSPSSGIVAMRSAETMRRPSSCQCSCCSSRLVLQILRQWCLGSGGRPARPPWPHASVRHPWGSARPAWRPDHPSASQSPQRFPGRTRCAGRGRDHALVNLGNTLQQYADRFGEPHMGIADHKLDAREPPPPIRLRGKR